MPAPTPTRAAVPPPEPEPGIWNPELGIKFGGAPTSVAQQGKPINGKANNPVYPNTRNIQGGQWDATRGVRFG